jgi:hypothetical protein
MRESLREVAQKLGAPGASQRAAAVIAKFLSTDYAEILSAYST